MINYNSIIFFSGRMGFEPINLVLETNDLPLNYPPFKFF